MRRHARRLWRVLALIPLMGVFNLTTCQVDVLRNTADALDETADDLGDDDVDLGDLLSDVVEDW